jgi:LysR family hca operon transcriptional activator
MGQIQRCQPGTVTVDHATVAVCRRDAERHRLAACEDVDVRDLAGEIFIGASDIASPMRAVIENHLAANGLDIEPAHRIHHLTMAMSLIASTRGVALLPAYAENFLPSSVTSRPLKGEAPTQSSS